MNFFSTVKKGKRYRFDLFNIDLTIEQIALIFILVIYPMLHFSLEYLGKWQNDPFHLPGLLVPLQILITGSLLLLTFAKAFKRSHVYYLSFTGLQIYLSFILLLAYLNDFSEVIMIVYWATLIFFCLQFNRRKHLAIFLVINYVLGGGAVLLNPENPFPDSLLLLWYPVIAFITYWFLGEKISDREQLNSQEGMLKESEEMFKLIFEEANYGIVITNRAKQIIRVNKAMCAMFKYSEAELLTMGSHDLTYPEDQNVTFQLFDKANIKGKDQYTTEKRYICKDGEVITCNVSVRIIRDLDNRHVLNIGLIENITERKKDETKIKEYARKLKQSNKDLEDFAYVVSHDLREPLRMISSYLQLIDKRYSSQLGPAAAEYIGFATDGAKRMNRLILDLLSYSRVGRENVKKWVDTNRVIELAIRNLKLKIYENDAIIEYGDLPTLMANEIQLVLLFQNLIQNAIKYRRPEEKPLIKISASRKGEYWEFVVEDNGKGIDRAFIEHIFVIFYQAKPDDPETTGSGIGLAICQKIVKLHQGTITVESEVGKGTKFFLKFPYKPFVKDTPVEVVSEPADA